MGVSLLSPKVESQSLLALYNTVAVAQYELRTSVSESRGDPLPSNRPRKERDHFIASNYKHLISPSPVGNFRLMRLLETLECSSMSIVRLTATTKYSKSFGTVRLKRLLDTHHTGQSSSVATTNCLQDSDSFRLIATTNYPRC